MRPSTISAVSSVLGGIAGATVATLATKRRVSASTNELIFQNAGEMPFHELLPGVTRAIVYGHPDRGAHGDFVRFRPGLVLPRHKHSSEIRLVVLAGAYIYRADGREIRVGPQSVLVLPAGDIHVTAADPNEGCLFYEESPGPFDLIVVD